MSFKEILIIRQRVFIFIHVVTISGALYCFVEECIFICYHFPSPWRTSLTFSIAQVCCCWLLSAFICLTKPYFTIIIIILQFIDTLLFLKDTLAEWEILIVFFIQYCKDVPPKSSHLHFLTKKKKKSTAILIFILLYVMYLFLWML